MYWLLILVAVATAISLLVRLSDRYRDLKRENEAYRPNLESLVTTRTHKWDSTPGDPEKSLDITLQAFGDALDLKNAETERHNRRVTAYTIAIARRMDLPKDRILIIARGAFLHDIGNMAIPGNILGKVGRLTEEEMRIMRQHAYTGYKILANIPSLVEASEIVYSHHECFDGSGYPRGLKGEEIPLGARIFALADTLDAMTSDHPHRAAISFDDARKQIEKCSGHQFDPAVVKAFLEMPGSSWPDPDSNV